MNIDILSSIVYEDLNGSVTDINHGDHNCSFVLSIDDPDNLTDRLNYKIICNNVAESTLQQGFCGRLLLASDDPILADHNEPSSNLSFSKASKNPHEVLGRLYESHENLFQGYRPLSQYLNNNQPITELLSSFGFLASGPVSVLKEYQSALKPVLQTKIGSGSERTNTYKLLFIEDHFIVCKGVSVEKC